MQNRLDNTKQNDSTVTKLLLLGAGESGKSTLFKQMVMIYDNKHQDPEERKAYIELIYQNVIQNAKVLCDNSYTHGEPTTPEGLAAREFIDELEDDDAVDAKIATHIKALWQDPGIQECYENRALFQLNDSTQYFMDMIDTIASPDWIPDENDIVRTRVRTTGIVEHNFEIEDQAFKMFDVGGQRNERKKWIHCFENVTAVMFVAAISEFDQVLYEDDVTNRMTEALHLFSDIAHSQWFKKTTIILFLNKLDLFVEKIKTKNISDSACEELQSFQGNNRDLEETKEHIEMEFRKKSDRCIPHFTCATNQDNVHMVFDSMKQVILQQSLEEAGFM